MPKEKLLYIQTDHSKYLFSKGILAKRLEVLGVSFQEAYECAISIENDLLNIKDERITQTVLNDITYKFLLKKYNKKIAYNYKLIEKWRQSDIPLWIIIAGAIGVGKSTLARKIANDFDIQHIVSTELIRDVLRKTLSSDISPELHTSSYLAYQTLRPIYSERYDKVILGYENHAKFVNIGVEAVLNRAAKENISLIIEGEHLLPSFFDNEKMSLPNLVYFTLCLEDKNAHRKNISEQYSKEKDKLLKYFNNIRKIHDYLESETKLRKLSLVEVVEGKDPISKAREIIINKIKNLMEPLSSH